MENTTWEEVFRIFFSGAAAYLWSGLVEAVSEFPGVPGNMAARAPPQSQQVGCIWCGAVVPLAHRVAPCPLAIFRGVIFLRIEALLGLVSRLGWRLEVRRFM
jgi:hypothetical protein